MVTSVSLHPHGNVDQVMIIFYSTCMDNRVSSPYASVVGLLRLVMATEDDGMVDEVV